MALESLQRSKVVLRYLTPLGHQLGPVLAVVLNRVEESVEESVEEAQQPVGFCLSHLPRSFSDNLSCINQSLSRPNVVYEVVENTVASLMVMYMKLHSGSALMQDIACAQAVQA